jgi:glycosyltransferase involved in cell wall biosynthesis
LEERVIGSRFSELFNSEIGELILMGDGGEKQKPRILFYSNVWHRGGVERVLSVLLTHLAPHYECVLVVGEDSIDKDGFKIPKSVRIIRINNKSLYDELISITLFLGIDVFVGNPNISEKFLGIYPLLSEVGVKTIAYNHGYYFLPYMCGDYLYPVANAYRTAFSEVNAVIWLTSMGSRLYNLENNNGVHISNPAIISSGHEIKESRKKRILTVGRFDDGIKQIEQALLVIKELVKYDSEYTLDIVGPYSMEMEVGGSGLTLEEFIAREKIPPENYVFHGKRVDVDTFYKNDDFLILTSKCEGFGMVFLEAFSHAMPCASYDFLGLDEIIKHGKNGWIVPQQNPAAMAKLIHETLENGKQYEDMSKDALSAVDGFSVDKFNARWDTLLRSLLGADTTNELVASSTQPSFTAAEYKKVICEYERILGMMANYSLEKEKASRQIPEVRISRARAIKIRFDESLKRDGVLTTMEKIARKAYTKMRHIPKP